MSGASDIKNPSRGGFLPSFSLSPEEEEEEEKRLSPTQNLPPSITAEKRKIRCHTKFLTAAPNIKTEQAANCVANCENGESASLPRLALNRMSALLAPSRFYLGSQANQGSIRSFVGVKKKVARYCHPARGHLILRSIAGKNITSANGMRSDLSPLAQDMLY